MDISLSDVLTFLRLILDILVVWALIYSAFRLVRNNSRIDPDFKRITGYYDRQSSCSMDWIKYLELFD